MALPIVTACDVAAAAGGGARRHSYEKRRRVRARRRGWPVVDGGQRARRREAMEALVDDVGRVARSMSARRSKTLAQ